MQNIAANPAACLRRSEIRRICSFYTEFGILNGEFVRIMAPPFILSVSLITLCCLIFVKPEPLSLPDRHISLSILRKQCCTFVLFAFSIAIVFRGIPYQAGPVIIPAVLLLADRKALADVDYPPLATFVFFFSYSRATWVELTRCGDFFSALLEKNTLVFSALSCQVISNVPSAILLSQFTDNYADLLVGVNIGGVGTLISSLASLITFREYTGHNPNRVGRYILEFSVFNFAFLLDPCRIYAAYEVDIVRDVRGNGRIKRTSPVSRAQVRFLSGMICGKSICGFIRLFSRVRVSARAFSARSRRRTHSAFRRIRSSKACSARNSVLSPHSDGRSRCSFCRRYGCEMRKGVLSCCTLYESSGIMRSP